MHNFPRIHFKCIPDFRVIFQMYPAFPFDPPTQSGTFSICNMGMSGLPDMYTLKRWDIHPSSVVMLCKVKYTDENSNINSGILYNRFLIVVSI